MLTNNRKALATRKEEGDESAPLRIGATNVFKRSTCLYINAVSDTKNYAVKLLMIPARTM
jgi:hypothetical protein